jgi:hypothetical protein
MVVSQLPMQSVPITIDVVGSTPAQGEVYNICNKVFVRVLRFPPSVKTYRHDITEILLKVAFNTITPTNQPSYIE